ncbi:MULTISPECIES: hypothetical protein [Anaerotignum]|nr:MULTISPECIES: hypothetical protein [Anaerotignum]MEA5058260.1 hypothetical protein [Anaerotignum propionicum]
MKQQSTKLNIGRGASMEVKAPKDAESAQKPKVQKGNDLRSGK